MKPGLRIGMSFCVELVFCILLLFLPPLQASGISETTGTGDAAGLLTLIHNESDHGRKAALINQLCYQYASVRPDSVAFYGKKALEEAQKGNNQRAEAEAMYYVGLGYYFNGDFRESQRWLIGGLPVARRFGADDVAADILNILAVVNAQMGDLNQALFYFRQIVPQAEKLNQPETKLIALINIANCFKELNRPDSEVFYFRKCLGLITTHTDSSHLPLIYSNMALYFDRYNLPDSARYYSANAVREARRLNDREILGLTLANHAVIFNHQAGYRSALGPGIEAREIAAENNLNDLLLKANMALAGTYTGLRDFEKANQYYEQSIVLRDTLFSQETRRQVLELQTRYETELKDRDLQLITASVERKDLAIKLISVVLLLVVGLLSVIVYLYIRRNQAYRHLVSMNLALLKKESPKASIQNTLPEEAASDETTGKEVTDTTPSRYRNSPLSDEHKQAILAGFTSAMQSDRLFLDPDLTIDKVATLLQVSSKYLSQAVNEQLEMNFSAYVSLLRVEEARRLLASRSMQHFTIEAIGEKAGFKNRASFNTTFKKATGLTPSYFRNSVSGIV